MPTTPLVSGLKLVGICAALLIWAALVLWLSGDWKWIEGWIFAVWFVSLFGVIFLWLNYNDPELLAERLRMPGTGGEPRSDLAILIGVKVLGIGWLVLPSLDVRFGWMPRLPLWSEVCGGILLVGGSVLIFRALTENPFASQLVRIQTERGQHVIDTGVYGFVRHPMYLGACLMFVGGPMLLGSTAGLFVGLGLVLLFVVRIFGEEKLLVRDLQGYQAYRQKVRYRLVPHVW